MQPRRTKAYFGLTPTGKVCYHNGMPLRQCQSKSTDAVFRAEKIGEMAVTASDQKKVFDQFRKHTPSDPQTTIFSSQHTDEDSLEAASVLLRGYVDAYWGEFLFVNQDDPVPRDPELVQGLYILMGVRSGDDTGWVRRWIRSRLGVPIWICLTAPKPYEWYHDELGIKPDFLFSVKGAARASG